MTPQEQENTKVVKDLQAIARNVDRQLPFGWGFVVLAFPFGADGRMNYVANAERTDVVRAMYEFIEASKGQWAEHKAPIGAAAEDEQLGRARQRIAELERELDKALEERREWMEKVTIDRQRIAELQRQAFSVINLKDLEYLMEVAAAHLTLASPFNDKWKERAKAYQVIFQRRIKEAEE